MLNALATPPEPLPLPPIAPPSPPPVPATSHKRSLAIIGTIAGVLIVAAAAVGLYFVFRDRFKKSDQAAGASASGGGDNDGKTRTSSGGKTASQKGTPSSSGKKQCSPECPDDKSCEDGKCVCKTGTDGEVCGLMGWDCKSSASAQPEDWGNPPLPNTDKTANYNWGNPRHPLPNTDKTAKECGDKKTLQEAADKCKNDPECVAFNWHGGTPCYYSYAPSSPEGTAALSSAGYTQCKMYDKLHGWKCGGGNAALGVSQEWDTGDTTRCGTTGVTSLDQAAKHCEDKVHCRGFTVDTRAGDNHDIACYHERATDVPSGPYDFSQDLVFCRKQPIYPGWTCGSDNSTANPSTWTWTGSSGDGCFGKVGNIEEAIKKCESENGCQAFNLDTDVMKPCLKTVAVERPANINDLSGRFIQCKKEIETIPGWTCGSSMVANPPGWHGDDCSKTAMSLKAAAKECDNNPSVCKGFNYDVSTDDPGKIPCWKDQVRRPDNINDPSGNFIHCIRDLALPTDPKWECGSSGDPNPSGWAGNDSCSGEQPTLAAAIADCNRQGESCKGFSMDTKDNKNKACWQTQTGVVPHKDELSNRFVLCKKTT